MYQRSVFCFRYIRNNLAAKANGKFSKSILKFVAEEGSFVDSNHSVNQIAKPTNCKENHETFTGRCVSSWCMVNWTALDLE